MISLSLKQFQETVVYKNSSEVIFDNCLYAKGPSFPEENLAAAIKYCDLYQKNNSPSLLVKQQDCLTIWIKQAIIESIEPSKEIVDTEHTTDTVSTDAQIKLRQYRGQTYEHKPQNQVAIQKQKIIYRGHSCPE